MTILIAAAPTMMKTSRLMTVMVTMTGAVILFPLGGWTPPSNHALVLLALAAVFMLIGYQCMIMALRSGDISAVAPFRYTALPWAMLLGYLVFGDRPDATMVTGASIIVSDQGVGGGETGAGTDFIVSLR